MPTIQVRRTQLAPQAPSLMGAMNLAALDTANAPGAWSSGATVGEGWGVLSSHVAVNQVTRRDASQRPRRSPFIPGLVDEAAAGDGGLHLGKVCAEASDVPCHRTMSLSPRPTASVIKLKPVACCSSNR